MLKDWKRQDISVHDEFVSLLYKKGDNLIEVRLDEVRVGVKMKDGEYVAKIIKHDFRNPSEARKWALDYMKTH
jgi:hypothetical protein